MRTIPQSTRSAAVRAMPGRPRWLATVAAGMALVLVSAPCLASSVTHAAGSTVSGGQTPNWTLEKHEYGSTIPKGSYRLDYAHAFDGPPATPWTTYGTPPKPTRYPSSLDPVETIQWGPKVSYCGKSVACTATSEWKVEYWKQFLPNCYVWNLYTRSSADAGSHTPMGPVAYCATRISDPVDLSFTTDSDWTAVFVMGLVGDMDVSPQGEGSIEVAYEVAFDGAPYESALTITIPGGDLGNNVSVWKSDSFHFARAGTEWTTDAVKTEIENYYGPNGWHCNDDPGPDVDKGLSFDLFYWGHGAHDVSFRTSVTTYASDASPELPASLLLACCAPLALVLIAAQLRAARAERQGEAEAAAGQP